MISSEQARTLATMSNAASTGGSVPDSSYVLLNINLKDEETGFDAKIYKKVETGEYIIAFADTQNGQDVAADTALGTTQWLRNRNAVLAELQNLDVPPTSITFAGRSLGGALAQYAAYDYVDYMINTNSESRPAVSLATFNGLGGIAGLMQMHGNGFNESIADEIDAAHFYASSSGRSDLVARLGEGHLGGNTYEIVMDEPNAGILSIHRAWNDFEALTIPQSGTSPDYLGGNSGTVYSILVLEN